jgi:hypothetical protein
MVPVAAIKHRTRQPSPAPPADGSPSRSGVDKVDVAPGEGEQFSLSHPGLEREFEQHPVRGTPRRERPVSPRDGRQNWQVRLRRRRSDS